MSRYLVTGAAGFIGFHLSRRLMERGETVVGLDNLNDYYDVSLKQARLEILNSESTFEFQPLELADRDAVSTLFRQQKFDAVIHLAAQAGVRYSLENPAAYIDSNLVGFGNILEGCRHNDVKHLIYASSSSVYGSNQKVPFSVEDNVDHPISLYAATKKANELMAHTYSHLYQLPTTGLRFFTVYGPWGRPDMALFKFTKAILDGQPIDVYNHGNMRRDFTYIDDIVEGVIRTADLVPVSNNNLAPYSVYNIGNNKPEDLMEMIHLLEDALGQVAEKNMLPMQPGDVPETYADIETLSRDTGFRPQTPLATGISKFVEWYREFYNV
ncbi:MAG: NAD-dependent epimerase [Planctomycetaceae bacterium]|nr:NAD-dependent epimerase [bacterium]MDG2390567.1 NAD-dependent epimerase [Planctomycetaceae bacterium]